MAGTDDQPETPERRACRTRTTQERRGVEATLNRWRPGDANPRNIYIGNVHVAVVWDPELAAEVMYAMNQFMPGRDCASVCRAHNRRCIQQHVDDIGHACVFCTTQDALLDPPFQDTVSRSPSL